MDKTAIYKRVQEHYGIAAKGTDTAYGQTVARAFGYSTEELAMAPEKQILELFMLDLNELAGSFKVYAIKA
ncbi:hypothetical protein LTR41_001600 [Exophiala xenobiotica]|nr:hypothetical protein LTR41_001600 [Exophiala xenobiotica]